MTHFKPTAVAVCVSLAFVSGCGQSPPGPYRIGEELIVYDAKLDMAFGRQAVIPSSSGETKIVAVAVGTKVLFLGAEKLTAEEEIDRVKVTDGEHKGQILRLYPINLRRPGVR